MSDEYLWEDESGTWAQDVSDPSRFRLICGPDKVAVSSKIDARDVWHLVGASAVSGKHADAQELRFPRNFRFHPITGEQLVVGSAKTPRTWVPPYGAPTPEMMPRGVRRTPEPLRVAVSAQSQAASRRFARDRKPDVRLPGPGKYEFVVGRFGAWADSLLAVDRVQGLLYAWMTPSEKWLQLAMPPDRPNLDWALDGDRWGMELLQSPGDQLCMATAFVPSEDGLAMIEPRVLSLDCKVKVVCPGNLCGAPAAWEEQVWVPIASNTSKVGCGMVVCSDRGEQLAVENAPSEVELRPPVSNARQVVWPSIEGQVVLARGDGRLKAQWIPWPEGFVPRFEYGAPYVDKSATFWQVGWVEAQASFVYVPVGMAKRNALPVDGWRFNTGSVVYHRLTRWRHDPWKPAVLPPGQEPGPDFAMPIIESEHEHGCICLRFQPSTASESAGEVLSRRGKLRAEVFYEADDETRIEIDSLEVVEPWHARLFVHDAMLWLYHPDLEIIRRWDIQSLGAGPTPI